MRLTELELKKLKTKERTYSVSDGRGLILEIRPNGSKIWVVRCYADNKEKRRSVGKYPDVSLKEARKAAMTIKSSARDINESDKVVTFRNVAEEWIETKLKPTSSKGHIDKTIVRISRHILPVLGDKSIKEVAAADILQLCRVIEAAGTIETAHRVKQIIGQICRYAVSTLRAENDPTQALRGALKPVKEKHHAALTDPRDILMLISNIRQYPQQVVRIAMMFSALTFCRPGNVRRAEWSDIDFEKSEWRIPAEEMKMKKFHIVPLSTQAIDILKELRPITEKWGKWLFPSARLDGRPMSENTIRVALRSMGYTNDDMTAHGFRGTASTILHEHEFSHEVIERQLAHAPRDAVAAAYNHAEYLPERRRMMQWWADWLDSLKV